MVSLIDEWAGKVVSVALRTTIPVSLEGKLVRTGEAGVMLELAQGQTFVPFAAILHISLKKGQ